MLLLCLCAKSLHLSSSITNFIHQFAAPTMHHHAVLCIKVFTLHQCAALNMHHYAVLCIKC